MVIINIDHQWLPHLCGPKSGLGLPTDFMLRIGVIHWIANFSRLDCKQQSQPSALGRWSGDFSCLWKDGRCECEFKKMYGQSVSGSYGRVHRRKFRSETSDNMDSWKAEVRRVRRDKIRRKKMQMREKVGKSRNTVFPMICGSGGSKSRLAKAAGAEPAGQMRDEKLHAVVARSTFPSQNVQNTPGSDHFWKLRCRKSARRCGAKHISKSKCTKRLSFGPLLEVEMSKKCTPLWREAHFQVKMHKTPQLRTTFGSCDVEKVHAVVARSTFPSQNVQNTPFSNHFWRFRCRKSVEKVHAVVARSTFRSQKCKKLRVLSLFWREDVEKVDTDQLN